MEQIAFVLSRLIQLYILLVIVWVFGSWFPQWRYQAWYQAVANLVEPYINLFRGLNLRWQMLDLTPIAAILLLQVIRWGLLGMSGRTF